MKRSFTLLTLIFLCISAFSQAQGPKITANQLNQIGKNAQDIQKINEVIGSFEEITATLKSQLGSLNFAGLNDSMELQRRYIDTIFQILEASNLKLSVTADSLSTTTYTIVSLIDDTNKKFEDINKTASDNFLYTLAGLGFLALAGLILFIVVFIMLARHNRKSKAQFAELRTKLDKELQGTIKSIEKSLDETKRSLEGRIRITDSTLTRRLQESSDNFDKQLALNKTLFDSQIKTSSANYQKMTEEVQGSLKNELAELKTTLDAKISDTNNIISTHIESAKEILDKISGEGG